MHFPPLSVSPSAWHLPKCRPVVHLITSSLSRLFTDDGLIGWRINGPRSGFSDLAGCGDRTRPHNSKSRDFTALQPLYQIQLPILLIAARATFDDWVWAGISS